MRGNRLSIVMSVFKDYNLQYANDLTKEAIVTNISDYVMEVYIVKKAWQRQMIEKAYYIYYSTIIFVIIY